MVKREVFQWIRTGQKTIELRKGRAKAGDQAVFQCGRSLLRGKIVRKVEGTLSELLNDSSFKEIVPSATSVDEAKAYLKSLYGKTEGKFTAYYFFLFEALRMKCKCGHWNRVAVNKVFFEPPSPEPKVKLMIPMYMPAEVTKCSKCGRVIAAPKELFRTVKGQEIIRYRVKNGGS